MSGQASYPEQLLRPKGRLWRLSSTPPAAEERLPPPTKCFAGLLQGSCAAENISICHRATCLASSSFSLTFGYAKAHPFRCPSSPHLLQSPHAQFLKGGGLIPCTLSLDAHIHPTPPSLLCLRTFSMCESCCALQSPHRSACTGQQRGAERRTEDLPPLGWCSQKALKLPETHQIFPCAQ